LVVPCKKGGYLVGIGKSVCHFDWDSKKLTVLQTVDEDKGTRINDGKCDASGRLWFGSFLAPTCMINTLMMHKSRKKIFYDQSATCNVIIIMTIRMGETLTSKRPTNYQRF
jgi:sugar lactone lactonase YvrE